MQRSSWTTALTLLILMLTTVSLAAASLPVNVGTSLLSTLAERPPGSLANAKADTGGALPVAGWMNMAPIRPLDDGTACDWDGCCSEIEQQNPNCGDCAIGACNYDGICEFDESDLCSDCMDSCQEAGGGPGDGGGGGPCVPLFDGPDCD